MYVGDVKTVAKEEGANDQQLVVLGFHTFTHAVFLIFFFWWLLKSWTWSRNSVQCLIFLCKVLKDSHGSNELLCPLSQFYFLYLFSSPSFLIKKQYIYILENMENVEK